MNKKTVAAGWLAICCSLVASEEGLRTSTYFDVGGVPTVCFGETKSIKPGDKFTPEQCREMLGNRVEHDFGPGVDKCAGSDLSATRKAAFVSFAYNAGIAAFCGSSMAKLQIAGNYAGACDALLKWNKVRIAGVLVVSPGLNNRRAEEHKLCMEDLTLSSTA